MTSSTLIAPPARHRDREASSGGHRADDPRGSPQSPPPPAAARPRLTRRFAAGRRRPAPAALIGAAIGARRAPHGRPSSSAPDRSGWLIVLLERGHRQPGRAQLLPVVLGRLAMAGPDDRLAAVVDRVRERHPAVVADAGDHPRERRGRRARRCCGRRCGRSRSQLPPSPIRARPYFGRSIVSSTSLAPRSSAPLTSARTRPAVRISGVGTWTLSLSKKPTRLVLLRPLAGAVDESGLAALDLLGSLVLD